MTTLSLQILTTCPSVWCRCRPLIPVYGVPVDHAILADVDYLSQCTVYPLITLSLYNTITMGRGGQRMCLRPGDRAVGTVLPQAAGPGHLSGLHGRQCGQHASARSRHGAAHPLRAARRLPAVRRPDPQPVRDHLPLQTAARRRLGAS